MDNEEKRIFLTPQQAFDCLIVREKQVHNFIPARFGLVGADWNLQDVGELLDEATSIEIGGEQCRKMNHGIAVTKGENIYFFEADNQKLNLYDNQQNTEKIVKSRMQIIAKKVQEELPEGYGFTVLTFKFNTKPDTSELMYVSNADRQDIVKAMEEWIEKTKTTFGNDTGRY